MLIQKLLPGVVLDQTVCSDRGVWARAVPLLEELRKKEREGNKHCFHFFCFNHWKYQKIAKMALNHNEVLSSSPLLHVALSSNPKVLSSPSLNMSAQHTTNISSGTETILSNSSGAVAGAAILGLVFLLGVPGNMFIVWSILARARRRSITTLLILNLAFADGFLMLLTPFFMVYLAKRSWIFGMTLCKVLFYLCCANMYASIFLIMLMSLHRLVAIVWPKRVGALTERKMLTRVLAVLWVLALGLSAPVLVFRATKEVNKESQSLVCDCLHPQPQYEVMQYGMETLLGFLLPYGVIIGSYMCILRRIRKTRFRRRIRSEKLILVIIVTFGLFWLPYHIINMVQVAAALHPDSQVKERLKHIRTKLRALTSTVAFVSSCINPILYTFAGKSYIRREGLAFMARLFEGTALETTRRIRRSNQNSRDREKETDEGDSLKDSDSTTNANLSSVIKAMPQINGSQLNEQIVRKATPLNHMATLAPPKTSVLSGLVQSSIAPAPPSAPSMPLSHQIGIAILVIAFVIGFPGNLFVVWSVLCRVRRRSVTCLLILNLAMADALVLLSAPLFIRYLAGGRGWEFGSALCKTVHYLCCVNMYASIYLICLMSVDRWLAVTKPFLSQRLRTKKRLLSVMLGIWVVAFLIALPMPFYRSVWPIRPGLPIYLCKAYHWDSDAHVTFQYLSETILGFLLPYILILFCYISVICRLRSAMFQRKGRGNFLILLIIAAFTVFWLPYHLINILQVIGVMQGSSSSVLQSANVARPNVTAFAFLSSSVNPVLYVFAGSSHIRQAGLGFMAKLFEGTNSESASTRSSRGSNAESSVFTKLSVKLNRKGDERRAETPGGEDETTADMYNKDEIKTLTTLH
ncbi:hypothetical protein QQF64_031039 [Cirrhinus molitorella]|uniref:G-protein coupled receptors family 1 profile domain-containing protein n=1 Tax=Cirrhinus molitorella TaxID=172907 RepID=A0ABR3N570_9TELE